MKRIQKAFRNLLCTLGFHDWVNIDPWTPIPDTGQMICYQNLHECTNCKKEQPLGMGCIM